MFQDTGEPLQQLLDNGTHVHRRGVGTHGRDHRALLDHGLTVLHTQQGQSENIRAFSHDLAADHRLARAERRRPAHHVSEDPGAAREVDKLLKDLEPTLPVLLANAASVSQVGLLHLAGLEQLLVIFPRVIAGGFTGTPQDGYGHVNLQFDNSVQPCTQGYKPHNAVAAAQRPLRRADLPGQVHRRAAVRPARDSVLARRPERHARCGVPRGLRPDARASSTAWSTRTATRCTSATRATSRCSATTPGSGCSSDRWWRLSESSSRQRHPVRRGDGGHGAARGRGGVRAARRPRADHPAGQGGRRARRDLERGAAAVRRRPRLRVEGGDGVHQHPLRRHPDRDRRRDGGRHG